LGLAFTPDKNITVTHVRHYAGVKISIWDESQNLIVSKVFSATSGSWGETALDVPVVLNAGTRYRVAFYTGGSGAYYYNFQRPLGFADGSVDGVCTLNGDGYPSSFSASTVFYLVDLRYEVPAPVPVAFSPTASGVFNNGTWTGSLTPLAAANNVNLIADDGDGHTGQSATFNVLPDSLLGRTLPPTISLRLANPQQLELEVSGLVSGPCIIESSTDLKAWTPFSTNSVVNGRVVVNPGPASGAARFYRAKLLP
jgi:hypothetical protein